MINRVSVVGISDSATGWTVRGSNPGGGKRFFYSNGPDQRWDLLSLQLVPGFFPGGKATGA